MTLDSDESVEVRYECFFIPWIGPSLNRIWAGMPHFLRTKLKNRGHWSTIVVKGKIVPFAVPVDLIFTAQVLEKGDRYDCTNYGITNKVIEDALVTFGIIPEDGPDDVLSVKTDTPIYGKEPGMWVEIIESPPYEKLLTSTLC